MIPVLALALATATPPAGPSPSPAPTVSATAYYLRSLGRLDAVPSSAYAEYSMHQVKPGMSLTEEVRERRDDRASWNLVVQVDGWRKRVGQVDIGRHYLVPDAFLPLFARTVRRQASGILPDLGSDARVAGIAPVLHYRVRTIDIAQLDGCGSAAHLALDPVGDADTYNVREIWVRASDGALCRAIYRSYLFELQGEHTKIGSIVDARVNDLGLITSWRSQYVLGRKTFPLDGTFSDVEWSSVQPAYYFDRRLWDARRSASGTAP